MLRASGYPHVFNRTVISLVSLKSAAPRVTAVWHLDHDMKPGSPIVYTAGNKSVYPWGIDGKGRLVTRIDDPDADGKQIPVVWENRAEFTALEMGAYRQAGVISVSGNHIASSLSMDRGSRTAIARWTNGTMEAYDAGAPVHSHQVNASGDIVRWIQRQTFAPPTAILWRAREKRPCDLIELVEEIGRAHV